MYYEEDFVEEVRRRNDIVDIISSYVYRVGLIDQDWRRKGAATSACARFTTRKRLPFPSAPESRCTIVLAAAQAEMYLPF